MAFDTSGFGQAPATDAESRRQSGLHLVEPQALTRADLDNWDRLGREQAGDNVFAEPWLMRLSLAHCDPQRGAHLAVVVDELGRWIGVMPVVRRSRLGRMVWPHWALWNHPNQFIDTPLVRAGQQATFWRGLLHGFDKQPGSAVALALTNLPQDDPVNAALIEVCAADRRGLNIYRRHARACLSADEGLPARIDAACRPKHRRRIESLERQLVAEHGGIALRSTRDPAEIARLVEPFLDLEAAGWKGAAHSAMRESAGTRAYFREVALAAAALGKFEVSWLEVEGRPIDMTTQFLGANWSCGFKRAHDERYARFAPGLIHLRHLTRRLADQRGASFDSCAAPDQESINRIWPDRRDLFDCTLAIGGPLRRLSHQTLCRIESGFHAIKHRLHADV